MVGLSSSYSGTPQLMTRLTMALLEDSGWYSPRWHNAAVLTLSNGAGCGWFSQTQAQYTASNPSTGLYCTPVNSGGARGACGAAAMGA
jgi:hypothetical protein